MLSCGVEEGGGLVSRVKKMMPVWAADPLIIWQIAYS